MALNVVSFVIRYAAYTWLLLKTKPSSLRIVRFALQGNQLSFKRFLSKAIMRILKTKL